MAYGKMDDIDINLKDIQNLILLAIQEAEQALDELNTIDLNNPDIALEDAKSAIQEGINYLKDI